MSRDIKLFGITGRNHNWMVERFPNGFEGAVNQVENSSNKALYKFLNVHILGPYDGDCHAYLTELKYKLRESGFERAKLCSDRGDSAPDHYDREERAKYWLDISKDFLEQAHVAIFVFLDDNGYRPHLPDRAFEKDPADEDYEVSQDLNISVERELEYWLQNIDQDREKTLVLFEEECYQNTGSLVIGEVEAEGVDYDDIESNNVEMAFEEARARCQNWAMGTCKTELTDLYYEEELD